MKEYLEVDSGAIFTGHIYTAIGPWSWTEGKIEFYPESRELIVRLRNGESRKFPFWGLFPLGKRSEMYPLPVSKDEMWGVRTNPTCSVDTDPNWTERNRHGNYAANECCMTVVGVVFTGKLEKKECFDEKE